MPDVTETQLPGVGVRYEFTTGDGRRIGVLNHTTGRRDLVVYDDDDPDAVCMTIGLDDADARTLADLLGATQVAEVLHEMKHRVQGMALDWVDVPASSPLIGGSIGSLDLRTRTGATVVAVVRDNETDPAPGPDFVLAAGDTLVATGAPIGLEQLRALVRG